MRKLAVGFGIPLGILLVTSIMLWVYRDRLNNRYDQVQAEMPEVKQKLIDLNKR